MGWVRFGMRWGEGWFGFLLSFLRWEEDEGVLSCLSLSLGGLYCVIVYVVRVVVEQVMLRTRILIRWLPLWEGYAP